MRLKVLLAGTVHYSSAAVDELARDVDVIRVEAKNRAELLEGCKPKGPYDNAFAVLKVDGASPVFAPWDNELVDGLPDTLRFICSMGAGVDFMSGAIEGLTKRGIQISNTPEAVDESTSTTAIFLMLSALRHFYQAESSLRRGEWQGNTPHGRDTSGKLLGIVGLGGIGKQIAQKACAFGMRIAYYNRHQLDNEEITPGVTAKYYSTLDALLEAADVVALSVPLNESTRNLMSSHQFKKMRKGSILVNTARGGVVDEEALLAALESGHLASAGLDVFPNEPNVNEKLRSNPKLALLPHMGTWTVEALGAMEKRVFANAGAALKDGRVLDLIGPQQGRL